MGRRSCTLALRWRDGPIPATAPTATPGLATTRRPPAEGRGPSPAYAGTRPKYTLYEPP